MKTLTQIVREIFKTKVKIRKATKAEETPEPENQISQTLNQNQKPDETKDHEMAGDSGMVYSDAPETYSNVEKHEERESSQGESGRGDVEEGGNSGVEPLEEEKVTEDEKENQSAGIDEGPRLQEEFDIEEALKKAYREGEIAGRNAVIEAKYFPKTDDGIPHFRGKTSRMINREDIFSMAREA